MKHDRLNVTMDTLITTPQVQIASNVKPFYCLVNQSMVSDVDSKAVWSVVKPRPVFLLFVKGKYCHIEIKQLSPPTSLR